MVHRLACMETPGQCRTDRFLSPAKAVCHRTLHPVLPHGDRGDQRGHETDGERNGGDGGRFKQGDRAFDEAEAGGFEADFEMADVRGARGGRQQGEMVQVHLWRPERGLGRRYRQRCSLCRRKGYVQFPKCHQGMDEPGARDPLPGSCAVHQYAAHLPVDRPCHTWTSGFRTGGIRWVPAYADRLACTLHQHLPLAAGGQHLRCGHRQDTGEHDPS